MATSSKSEPEKDEEKDADDDEDECAICSMDLVEEFSRPEPCYHRFHQLCIRTWSGIRLTCPMCRKAYDRTFTYSLVDKSNPKLTSTELFDPPREDMLDTMEMSIGMNPYEHTVCKICGGGDSEENILLCDDCDEGFHMHCLTPALSRIPRTNWYCPTCEALRPPTRRRRIGNNHSVATRTVGGSRTAYLVTRRLGLSLSESSETDSEEEREVGEEEEPEDEEEDDYSAMDQAVLDAMQPGTSTGVRVQRKKKETKKKGKAKPNTRKRRPRQHGPLRRRRRRKTARNVKDESEKNEPYSPSRVNFSQTTSLRGLRVTGGGIENDPYFDDEVADIPSPPSPVPTEEGDKEDNGCDLLGTILSEQEKVLADGKFFKIESGKFEPTKAFQKYQENLHKKFDNESRKRLGMPYVEDNSKPWDQPTSSKAPEPEISLDDADIDPEVREQIELVALQDKELAEQKLYEAQRKAIADQKREKMERKIKEGREKEHRERTRRQLQYEADEHMKQMERIRADRERREKREQERKEREEKRKREKEEQEQKEVEQRRRREEGEKKSQRRRSRSRSPRHRDKKDDHNRGEKKREERHKEKRDHRKDEKREAKPNVPSALDLSISRAVMQPLPPQAPPDYGSLYGNPFQVASLPFLSLPEQQALLMAQQQLPFGGLPISVSLPLAANGYGLGGQMAQIQPVAQPAKIEEKQKVEPKERDKHYKDQATKIIESYSIRIVTDYFKERKINREQYSEVMKSLIKEYRKSRSVEQLKTNETKKEIKRRTLEILQSAMNKNK